MITDIELPTPEALAPLREEALEGTEPSDFILKHVSGITAILKKNPAAYRSYGPYWWAIKALLKEHGIDFGEDDEPITREHFGYSDPVDLICAAWAYREYILEQQMGDYAIHPFTVDDEPYDYSIEDNDLEAMLVKF